MTKDLEQKLQQARRAYYKDGTSPLTDAEYDALEDELRAVDPDNPLLKEVGADTDSGWSKARHEIPMGSLNKVQNRDQYDSWLKSVGLNVGEFGVGILLISEKLDGSSIAVQYVDGVYTTD
ncbi:MAG: DNA ligase (NAD(+)) LigA, partial [bacterium]